MGQPGCSAERPERWIEGSLVGLDHSAQTHLMFSVRGICSLPAERPPQIRPWGAPCFPWQLSRGPLTCPSVSLQARKCSSQRTWRMWRCRRAPRPPSAAASPLPTTGLSTGSWTRHPCLPMNSMRSRPSPVATTCSPCGSWRSRTRARSILRQATSEPQLPCRSQVGCGPSAQCMVGASPYG